MKTVLIIHESAAIATLWRAAFERHELRVIHEPQYKQAIKLLGESTVDLVITNVALPNGNGELLDFSGLAILSYITLELKNVQVIAVTDSKFDQTNLPFLQLLKSAKLLQKPFNVDTIVDLGLKLIAEKSLERRIQKMKAVEAKVATDFVFWVNPDGEFVYASEAAAANYQYSKKELMGMTVDQVNPSLTSVKQFKEEFWPLIKDHKSKTFTMYHGRRDGSTFPVTIATHYVEIEGDEFACSFVRDITQRMSDEKDLRLLNEAIKGSEDAFVITNVGSEKEHGISVAFANKAYSQMTGYSIEETIGRRPRSLEGPETNHDALMAIAAGLSNGLPVRTEILFYRKSETAFWCDFQMSPISDESGSFTHWLIVMRNITQQKELANERQMLRHSNSDLEQFAYVASHELQEPLRAVDGFMQILSRDYSEQLDETGKGYVRKSVAGAARMQQLINDLLHFSRVARDGQPMGAVRLSESIASAQDTLQSKISERGVLINVGQMPTIHGQPTQLTQLFQNLIGNAIKYCESDVPRVDITSEETEEFWQVSISDNGIGIAPEYRDQIFSIFKRLHRREEYPGTGIGLAICQRVIARHGGSISVEAANSQDGLETGSRFVLKFPKRAE